MEIKTILWPTDLSATAKKALPFVNDLAQKYDARVVLLYVAEDMGRYDHIYGDAGKHLAGLQEMERGKAWEHLEGACQEELKGCPAFDRFIVQGDPAGEILKMAKEQSADLIVLSSRGRGADAGEHQFYGSVSQKVVRHAGVPVLTINPGT